MINKAKIKQYLKDKDPDIRVSPEFYHACESFIRNTLDGALVAIKGVKRKTLKEEEFSRGARTVRL